MWHQNDLKEMITKNFLSFVFCIYNLDDSKLPENYTMKRPGALHKARWMAKLLYSTKIVLLENEISNLARGSVTTKQRIRHIHIFDL